MKTVKKSGLNSMKKQLHIICGGCGSDSDMSYTVNSEIVSIRCSRCGNHVFLYDVLKDNTPGITRQPFEVAPQSDEQSMSWSVKLIHGGSNKLLVVKTIKDATGLGLKESKDIVDTLGLVVTDTNLQKAKEIQDLLKEAGSEVQIINQRS